MKIIKYIITFLLVFSVVGFQCSAAAPEEQNTAMGFADENEQIVEEQTAIEEQGENSEPAILKPIKKRVAFTFDDGPTKYTAKLLDELAKRDVKATFFVIGYMAKKRPEMLLKMKNDGHSIGSHTYYHKRLTAVSKADILSEIEQTNRLFESLEMDKPVLFRPPFGAYNKTVTDFAGGSVILWSVDPQDWKNKSAEKIKKDIVKNAFDGAIILCHDTNINSINGTLAAMDELLLKGYELVTVDELLFLNEPSEIGKVYSKGFKRKT